jgi:hypothetical protein
MVDNSLIMNKIVNKNILHHEDNKEALDSSHSDHLVPSHTSPLYYQVTTEKVTNYLASSKKNSLQSIEPIKEDKKPAMHRVCTIATRNLHCVRSYGAVHEASYILIHYLAWIISTRACQKDPFLNRVLVYMLQDLY